MNDISKLKELAKKHGYHGMFSHRDSIQEIVDWAMSMSNEERLVAVTAVRMTLNTIAMLKAKEELNKESMDLFTI
jgi:hypothetical protein